MIRLAAVWTLALAAVAGVARAADGLPPGVAATVHGRKITEKELWELVAVKHGSTVAGQAELQKLIVAEVIDAEAERIGHVVDESGFQTFIDGLVAQSGGRTLVETKLKEEGRDFEYFRRAARMAWIGGRLAARDLGLGDGQPSDAQFKVWLEAKMKSLGVEKEPSRLRKGVVAKLKGREITAERLGRAIAQEAGAGVVENVLKTRIVVLGIQRALERAGIGVTDADVDADLAGLRRDFERTNQFASTVTFEKWLEATKHVTVAELRRDPEYRSRVGLRKYLGSRLTDEQRRAYYDKNANRFGEARQYQEIVISAGEAKFGGKSRTFGEARTVIEQVAAKVRSGEIPWELAVQRYSEIQEKGVHAVHRGSPLPDGVRDEVFGAKVAGEIVGPVRAAYGYHLIKVIRIAPPLRFEEAKPAIDGDLLQAMTTEFYREVLADPGVVVGEAYR